MASVRKIDNLTVSVQNTIPQLSQIPVNDVVMMLGAGAPTIPIDEYTVSGKTITWDEVAAGYNLEVGDIVVADYNYDDGTNGGQPYDPANSEMNPELISYNMTVITEGLIPKLIHEPVASTLIVEVNSVSVTVGVDYTQNGKTLTWVSVTTLSVGDDVSVVYRKNV